ncbi:nuclease-related domain-containing protein [Planomicrobium okeanokoites]|uniref:Nuclease-related domain-containing protein n=1 Tax=Planomicrobium okeanokoites TaxID=244 RepID=A0ABV7KMF0_PLAOK|nr:nuclease-related domain-containing protein [Planomicrobium okeanokoites]TAA68281.1 NERD domain-containing protein [Planomicrobium okeanokoites]
MILKERHQPPEILQLESLLQRVPIVHPRFPHWTEQLRRMSAGFHGEQRVDSLFYEIPIDSPHYFIQDLFIQKPKSSHQIDSVLITSRFVLLLEIKSISGELNFDPQLRQFSRTNKDGSVDGMTNPDDQIRRHEKWMQQFLASQKISLPVIGVIVFTYPSSIVNSRPKNRIIIQSSGLPFLMDQLLLKYPDELLNTRKTRQLADRLLKLHSLRQLRQIEVPAGLRRGVLCPKCPDSKLTYRYKKWTCQKCSLIDPHAHLRTLQEYRVLINPLISNREFRDFTGIESVSIASKLLTDSKMTFQGSFKDRVYMIPESFDAPDSI